MNELKIILSNGLKGCCMTYTAKQMMQYTKAWFKNIENLEYSIIDITEDYWIADDLANLGYKYIKDRVFPLTYYNGKLIMFGRFPEGEDITDIINNPKPLTEKEVLEIVKQMQEGNILYDTIDL